MVQPLEDCAVTRVKGTVARWWWDRDYGFVEPDGSGVVRDVFVHRVDVLSDDPLAQGDRVEYRLANDSRGRLRALDVVILAE